jgi:hypothetical protein
MITGKSVLIAALPVNHHSMDLEWSSRQPVFKARDRGSLQVRYWFPYSIFG